MTDHKGRVLLLGLGMQGRAALTDLAASKAVASVTVVDTRKPSLVEATAPKVHLLDLDATQHDELAALMTEADVVIDLLPSPLGFPIARLAAEAGVNLVNTNYLTDPGETEPAKVRKRAEDIAQLRAMAEDRGITLLTEFGLDPGLDLVLAAEAVRQLDEVREFRSYGAGLPEPPADANPLRYKFSWSVEGALRTYARPARLVIGGREVSIRPEEIFDPPNVHRLIVEGLGEPLECFPNGDAVQYVEPLGLGGASTVARYTGRWPGHCAFWRVMAQSGLVGDQPVRVGDCDVSPTCFLAAALGERPQFRYSGRERDIAYIRVEAVGTKNGAEVHVIYEVIDRGTPAAGLSAMSRTVGFTASAGARMILSGHLAGRGLIGPLDVPFEPLRAQLAKRGVIVRGGTLRH